MATNLSLAAKHIKDCNALMITAGAGMGVDSGLPDFRGNEGFWKAYPSIAKMGISFYEMANPQWFQKDPKLAWAFYGHRQNLYRNTAPHAGFNQILEQAEHKRDGYFVFTSNVDGQFQKAGFSEDFIEECHGSIHHLQCSVPCSSTIWSADGLEIEIDLDKFQALDPLPLCPNCIALARPNILMFGDWGWISHRTGKQGERLSQWLETLNNRNSNLVIIEIGAGNAVPTVRTLSENIAMNLNAKLIRINPSDSEVPKGHISVSEGALEGIRILLGE
jgi:NAD-dependent SIR2 family protein deacetylase